MRYPALRRSVYATVLASVIVIPIQAPRKNIKLSDFKRLSWIAGEWVGSGGAYSAFYERYTFVNDSTIEQFSFTDASMTTISDRSTIALRNGRITQTSENARHNAVSIDARGITFIGAKPGQNSFNFRRAAKGAWLATLVVPGGKKTVYEMKPKRE